MVEMEGGKGRREVSIIGMEERFVKCLGFGKGKEE